MSRAEAVAARDREIRRLHAAGLSMREIGRRVGVHHSTVRETLDPDARAAANARRAAAWRRLRAVA